jgi:hypothetical protein
MKISRMFAVKALLLGAIALPTLMPAFGQQEVDPTWYDPWAPASKTMAQSAQVKAQPKHLRKTNSAAVEQPKVKKQAQAQVQVPRDADRQPAMIASK